MSYTPYEARSPDFVRVILLRKLSVARTLIPSKSLKRRQQDG